MKSHLFQPNLEIIDALPGSGKTEFFIRLARNLLRTEAPKKLYLYVAPTKQLLREVEERLVRGDPENLHKIHTVWIDNKEDNYQDKAGRLISQKLPALYSRNVSNPFASNLKVGQVLSDLLDPDNENYAGLGSVVLTTYAAFLRLPQVPESQSPRKVWIFFDEARKCLGSYSQYQIRPEDFFEILRLYNPTIYSQQHPNDLKYLVLKISKAPTEEELIASKSTWVSYQRSDQFKRFVKYLQQFDYHRIRLHLLISVKGFSFKYLQTEGGRWKIDFEKSTVGRKSKDTLRKISVYPFMQPTHMFDGYARVTMLSAFFKHSQMYHLLRQQNYRMVSLVHPNDSELDLIRHSKSLRVSYKWAQVIRSRSRKLQSDLRKRLRIVPLLGSLVPIAEGASGSALKRTLTKTLLIHGMILPRDVAEQVLELIQSKDLRWGTVKLVYEIWNFYYCFDSKYGPQSIPDKQKLSKKFPNFQLLAKIYRLVKPYILSKIGEPKTPLEVLASEASKWIKRNLTPDERPLTPLMVLNSIRKPLPYLPVNAGLYQVPTIWSEGPLVKDSLVGVRSNRGTDFDIADGPYLHGLNRWRDDLLFIHLAALNPPKEVYQLYSLMLPNYNPDYDHALENLVQTVYRTNLRVPGATAPIYLLVSHQTLAQSLCLMLKYPFKIIPTSSDLVELRLRERVRRPVAVSQEINKLKVYQARYRKYVEEDGKSEYRAKLEEVQARLLELGHTSRKRISKR